MTHSCHLCDFKVDKIIRLQDHIKIVHEGLKLFCAICNKTFRSSDSLKHHVDSIHEDKNPFQCDVCGKRFPLPSKVKKHITMVHEKKMPYMCTQCDNGFITKILLEAHTQSFHNSENSSGLKVNEWFEMDFSAKFEFMKDYFNYEDKVARNDGLYQLHFQCVICLPKIKVLKVLSSVPLCNLKTHMKRVHPELKSDFEDLTRRRG